MKTVRLGNENWKISNFQKLPYVPVYVCVLCEQFDGSTVVRSTLL